MSLPCFHAAALRLMICIFIVVLPDLTNPVTYKCLFVMIVIKVLQILYLSLNVGYFSKPHICTERGKLQHHNRDPFVPRDMKSWDYMVRIPAFFKERLTVLWKISMWRNQNARLNHLCTVPYSDFQFLDVLQKAIDVWDTIQIAAHCSFQQVKFQPAHWNLR